MKNFLIRYSFCLRRTWAGLNTCGALLDMLREALEGFIMLLAALICLLIWPPLLAWSLVIRPFKLAIFNASIIERRMKEVGE